MSPKEVVFNILDENINKYLKLDHDCNYIYSLFYQLHSCEDEAVKEKNPFVYNKQIDLQLTELERSLLNWLTLADINEKIVNDEILINFKDNISLEIKKDGVFYFKKKESDRISTFLIMYPEHPTYTSFITELEYIVHDYFDSKEKENFQKVLKHE